MSGPSSIKHTHIVHQTATTKATTNISIGEDEPISTLQTGTTTLSIDVAAIAKNRGLTAPGATELLQIIANQTFDFYKEDNDFLVFEHIMKSGGTSLSDILLNITGEAGILPGSKRSNSFDKAAFTEAQKQDLSFNNIISSSSSNNLTAIEEWWNSKRVVFSHSNLQPSKQTHPVIKETHTFSNWFQAQLPPTFSKNIKILTFLRDPLILIASNQNDWMCYAPQQRKHLKFRLDQWRNQGCSTNSSRFNCPSLNATILDNDELWQKVNSSADDPCMGLTNLTTLYDDWMEHTFIPVCATNRSDSSASARFRCKNYMEARQLPKPQCQSPQHLMNDTIMGPMMHNLYKHLMLNAPEIASAGDYEDYALRHLGGVTTPTRLQEFDMWWFGVTERMHESMCLLHYLLQIPFVETPRERVMSCRPLSAWSEADKALMVKQEVRGYSLLRAANAILDVRVAKMCYDVENNAKAASLLPSSCCA